MSEQFNPNDAFNFFRNLWKPLEAPMQAMFPPASEEEVERKIQELRVVENWLTMSVHMMQMTTKTMELQKASLDAMRCSAAPQGQPEE